MINSFSELIFWIKNLKSTKYVKFFSAVWFIFSIFQKIIKIYSTKHSEYFTEPFFRKENNLTTVVFFLSAIYFGIILFTSTVDGTFKAVLYFSVFIVRCICICNVTYIQKNKWIFPKFYLQYLRVLDIK